MNLVSSVQEIRGDESSIIKFLQDSDAGYKGFGEIYFSRICAGVDRGWKVHKEATSNVMVPHGRVLFVVAKHDFSDWSFVELGGDEQKRLTIYPMCWYRFRGLGNHDSIIANVLDIKHRDEQQSAEHIRLKLSKPTVDVLWDERAIK